MQHAFMSMILVLALSSVTWAGNQSATVSLETRWWNEHEFGWRLAEATGLRWAITDGISGRARVGGENVAAVMLAAEFEKQTGIKAEIINGVLVVHRPNEAKRRELERKLGAGGDEAVRAAWLLGWLKDARGWPALAEAAAGKDITVALSAAQALRRLDGEEPFGLYRWILPGRTVHGEKSPADGLWQRPMGECFPGAADAAELDAMTKSPWVPLREAAARLAPGLGAAGKRLAERLAADPSLPVRQAAQRSLRAWQSPPNGFTPVRRPTSQPDLKFRWDFYNSKGDAGARQAGPWLATFGGEEDLARLIEVYSTTKDVHVRNSTLYVIVANAGGPRSAALFRKLAALGAGEAIHGQPSSHGKYGLAMLMDGQKLADELGPLLGSDNWSLSSEFLLARFGGPPALIHLEKDITARRGHVAPLAIGYIGGPDAVRMLTTQPESDHLSTATAAARGLGETGLASAIAPLVEALSSPNRVVRSRAALALGRIGGPEAAAALASLLGTETEYLPRRSACQMLQEINSGVKAHAELVATVEKQLADFVPAFGPLNRRFGPDFPVGKMVSLGRMVSVASIGESRHDVDAFSGVLVRYGGCTGYYNNECMGYDLASGQWFVIRPPENLGLFYNETRAKQGCSPSLAFDAKSRSFWIGHAVWGTGHPSNDWVYPPTTCCKYDAATDRFEGNWPHARAGGGSTQYVADCIRGRIVPEMMGPTCTMIDVGTHELVDINFAGAPNLNQSYAHDPTVFDPVSGMILRGVQHGTKHAKLPKDQFGMWLFDPAAGVARQSKSPLPSPVAESRRWMHYDSLNREIIYLSPDGAHRYDRKADAWEKVADGDCSVYITLGFDPQHNVFLGWWGGNLLAFRHKNAPEGTRAFYGTGK